MYYHGTENAGFTVFDSEYTSIKVIEICGVANSFGLNIITKMSIFENRIIWNIII